MGRYYELIKSASKGFSLRGGPISKWRFPMNSVLYKKRLAAGPEPERPRAVWSNWNYDSEVFAFAKRLNEQFNESLLRQAFVDPGFSTSEADRFAELGLKFDASLNNMQLASEGEKVCRNYIRALFTFWYPNFPIDGIREIEEHLLSSEKMADIGKRIGAYDLIKSQEFPFKNETVQSCMFALVGALNSSSGPLSAQLFVNDFIVTQLIGKDLNEMWKITNPMGRLCSELKARGETSMPVSRLMWSTGVNKPTAAFIVGLYRDGAFFSKGCGETVDIAEEMAARDALRRIFGTYDERAPLPMGEKARKYGADIHQIYVKLMNQDNK